MHAYACMTGVLHACCMRVACVVHVCCMCVACMTGGPIQNPLEAAPMNTGNIHYMCVFFSAYSEYSVFSI